MAFERARARAARHGWWQRPGFGGAVGAIVILLVVLLVMALPLVFGTSMHGRAISCEKHVSYSSHGGNSTSYRAWSRWPTVRSAPSPRTPTTATAR